MASSFFLILCSLSLRALAFESHQFDSCADCLSIQVLSEDLVEGSYHLDSSAHHELGVHFSSTPDSISVVDMNGNPVIDVSKAVGNYRVINIAGTMFVHKAMKVGMEMVVNDLAVPSNFQDKTFPLNQDYFDHLANYLGGVPSGHHQLVLQESLSKLVALRDTKLITEAVFAMGSKLGISGRDYPAVLPLYMMILQLDKLLSNSTLLSSQLRSMHKSSHALTDDDDDCLANCPPCEDDLCLGMCGYSCSCWKWVCGDCCYHLGCYGHDVCCRENFIQIRCLFPIGISCESEYTC